jgi:hypothetical protein
MLGRAKVFERAKKYDECLEMLSEVCVVYPNFWPAVIEKAKTHIYSGEWD